MATTDTLLKLFQAVGESDLQTVKNLALEICVDEERKGHRTAARLLRGALRTHSTTNGMRETSPVSNLLSVSSALTRVHNDVSMLDIELRPKWRKALEELVDEWKHRDRLAKKGLDQRNKIFFFGPPGCGKSLTAIALGNELALPTFIVRFDAVIGAFLGQTAIHLRQLFHFSETNPCVLVLDELDALGKKRGNPLDVGELDRIVISLMQELEHAKPLGLIVATSNLPKHIDDALWRRFDMAVEFPRPTKTELRAYARKVASKLDLRFQAGLVKQVDSSRTFADCRKVLETQARRDALAK